MNIVRWF
ncbi:hypothetical protein AYI70_g4101, partial [Smittium culicis]